MSREGTSRKSQLTRPRRVKPRLLPRRGTEEAPKVAAEPVAEVEIVQEAGPAAEPDLASVAVEAENSPGDDPTSAATDDSEGAEPEKAPGDGGSP